MGNVGKEPDIGGFVIINFEIWMTEDEILNCILRIDDRAGGAWEIHRSDYTRTI